MELPTSAEMLTMEHLPDAQSMMQVILRPRTPGKGRLEEFMKLEVPCGATVRDLEPILHAKLAGGLATGESWAPSSLLRWWREGSSRSPALPGTTPSYHFFAAASSASDGGEDETGSCADDLRALPPGMAVGELTGHAMGALGSKACSRDPALSACLYYDRETRFGDEEELLCLECCALLACCGLCFAAGNQAGENKPQNPPPITQNTVPSQQTYIQNPQPVYYNDGPTNSGNNYYANNTYGVPPNAQFNTSTYDQHPAQYPPPSSYSPPPAQYPPPTSYPPPPTSYPPPAGYPQPSNYSQPTYYNQPPAQYSGAPGKPNPL